MPHRPDRFRSALRIAAAAVLLSTTGCAYRLGSMLPPDIKTVAIPTVLNKTTEPLIEVEVTRATIQEFQKDGSLEVAGVDEADAILRAAIVEYRLTPVSYRREKRTTANEYRLTMIVALELVRRSDDAVIARSNRAKGETVFELTGDLSSAKRRALPDAAEDLAHSIVEKVVESW